MQLSNNSKQIKNLNNKNLNGIQITQYLMIFCIVLLVIWFLLFATGTYNDNTSTINLNVIVLPIFIFFVLLTMIDIALVTFKKKNKPYKLPDDTSKNAAVNTSSNITDEPTDTKQGSMLITRISVSIIVIVLVVLMISLVLGVIAFATGHFNLN